MTDWRRRLAVVVGVGLMSTAAFGIPWDIDMADSQAVKAFEREMIPPPEGVVSQDNVLTPTGWTPATGTGMVYRTTEAGKNLTPFTMVDNSPVPLDLTDQKVIDQGEKMYGVYCTPCHGDGTTLGAVAAPGRFPAVPKLTAGDRLPNRTDGEVYLTILNGWGLMPTFDWALSNDEAWSIVAYIRKDMKNGQYIPPAPEPAETEEGDP